MSVCQTEILRAWDKVLPCITSLSKFNPVATMLNLCCKKDWKLLWSKHIVYLSTDERDMRILPHKLKKKIVMDLVHV